MARFVSGVLGLALTALAASPTLAVPAAPPDQIAYSGVLVDGGGIPLAGPVDLTARLYDAASGGTLIFKQSFSGVELSDGHYTLNLGPTGEASDSPANPLTTSLRTALTGNLVAGAGRFVEITLDTDPPLARVQLVLVPYAMRADHALTADLATTSLDTQAVAGLDGGVLTELFEHYNEDGGPPASDPSEGTADVDGDGEMNFVDPDNDDDTLSDSSEVAAGTDINLVTPSVASVTPDSGQADEVTPVTVTGNGFESGLSAQLGSQLLSVSNLTPTSFQADVGPHPGPYPAVADLLVTNTNGQAGGLAAAFTFDLTTPVVTDVTPNHGEGDDVTQVIVTGSGFESGLTAQFGSQLASVSNVTPTSFQAEVGPDPGPYPLLVDLLVTNTNGQSGGLPGAFTFDPPGGVGVVPLPFVLAGANLPVGITAQGAELLVFGTQKSAQNTYAVDTLVDGTIAFDRVLNLNSSLVPSVISWNASRVVHALRGIGGTTDRVQLFEDANGDEILAASEVVTIESPGDNPRTNSPALAFDGSGRPGGGYLRVVGSTSTAVAFHDRDGNGVFTGPNEVVTIEPVGGSTANLGDGDFDPSGRLGYVYYDSLNQWIRVAHDRSGDGDFDDSPGGVPELATAATTGLASLPCLDMSFDGSGRLAILYVIGGNPQLLYDRNGDSDFVDANENQALPGTGTSTGCDLGTSALSGRILAVHNPNDELRLLVDINDDGDFGDPAEDGGLGSPITAPLAVTTTAAGEVRVLATQGVVRGPVR